MKKIILVDFSKVISPIGISRFLANNIEKYLKIDKNKIREIYKKNISDLVTGKYSIFQFIEEIQIYLKDDFGVSDLKNEIYKIPKIDYEFLVYLFKLKNNYEIVLVSDIYKELGEKLKKELYKYFDNFIFSFEVGEKKSTDIFWENLIKKYDSKNIELFIDDKENNLEVAKKYGIKGFLFSNFKEDKESLSEIFLDK